MCVTRYHFLNPGEEQEKFYEQKYMLNVPLSRDDNVIRQKPQSWMQLCIEKDLIADAMSSLHSALSRGFSVDSLRDLARLYTEHGFITEDEADSFMAEVQTIDDSVDELQAHVTDQLLHHPAGNLLPVKANFNLLEYTKTFTHSQQRAFTWISSKIDEGVQVQVAIIGPAGS